jgi:flagellar hook-associated protein 1 FlgK
MGFNSLNIAKSGLLASQISLEVTSNNISNVNTDGYSRQRVDISAKAGPDTGKFSVGSGVEIEDITQIRNQFLDIQFRSESATNSELMSKSTAMENIESIFGEPSDYGISENLSSFFSALEELSYNAHDLSFREIVVQTAETLTDTFHTIADKFVNYQKDLDRSVSLTVDDINTKIEEIQSLNETIKKAELNGRTANELRDNRNLVVDQLSKLIDINTLESEEGNFIVNTSGTTLVNGIFINKLEAVHEGTDPITGNDTTTLYWEGSSTEAKPESGVIRGYLDMRDGDSQVDQGVPYYLSKLNDMAKAMVESFNTINNAGYTVPYDTNLSSQNVDFFNSANLTAMDISISDSLKESGWNISMSNILLEGEMNRGNSENGQSFIDVTTSVGDIEEYYQNTIAEMATNANYVSRKSSSQQEMTDFIEMQKLSVSEVSLDEEMINMVKYQQSYNASAKLITVIDDMLTTLINMVS